MLPPLLRPPPKQDGPFRHALPGCAWLTFLYALEPYTLGPLCSAPFLMFARSTSIHGPTLLSSSPSLRVQSCAAICSLDVTSRPYWHGCALLPCLCLKLRSTLRPCSFGHDANLPATRLTPRDDMAAGLPSSSKSGPHELGTRPCDHWHAPSAWGGYLTVSVRLG